jgi:hypothetical protein
LQEFPMLKTENLCGAVVYYDGKGTWDPTCVRNLDSC